MRISLQAVFGLALILAAYPETGWTAEEPRSTEIPAVDTGSAQRPSVQARPLSVPLVEGKGAFAIHTSGFERAFRVGLPKGAEMTVDGKSVQGGRWLSCQGECKVEVDFGEDAASPGGKLAVRLDVADLASPSVARLARMGDRFRPQPAAVRVAVGFVPSQKPAAVPPPASLTVPAPDVARAVSGLESLVDRYAIPALGTLVLFALCVIVISVVRARRKRSLEYSEEGEELPPRRLKRADESGPHSVSAVLHERVDKLASDFKALEDIVEREISRKTEIPDFLARKTDLAAAIHEVEEATKERIGELDFKVATRLDTMRDVADALKELAARVDAIEAGLKAASATGRET